MQKILFLSRYFPPEISGGARRSSAIIFELSKLGYNIKLGAPLGIEYDGLIGARHPIFPANPNSRIVVKANLKQKIANFVRKNFLLPDPEIRWVLRLVREIKKSDFIPDLIIASGPPESLYLAGEILRRHFGCKLIFDMRDPWIFPPQRQELNNPIRKFIETILGKIVFANVDGIIAVSKKVLDDGLMLATKKIESKIIGHFATEFEGEKANLPSETFNLVHTGSISISNPLSEFEPMFQSFENIAQKKPDLKLWLAGQLTEKEQEIISKSPFKGQVEIMGAVSMQEARALQMGADALLLVSGTNSHALPGKYSEYSMCGKPIILSQKGPWCELLPKDAKFFDLHDLSVMKKGISEEYPHSNSYNAAQKFIEIIESV